MPNRSTKWMAIAIHGQPVQLLFDPPKGAVRLHVRRK